MRRMMRLRARKGLAAIAMVLVALVIIFIILYVGAMTERSVREAGERAAREVWAAHEWVFVTSNGTGLKLYSWWYGFTSFPMAVYDVPPGGLPAVLKALRAEGVSYYLLTPGNSSATLAEAPGTVIVVALSGNISAAPGKVVELVRRPYGLPAFTNGFMPANYTPVMAAVFNVTDKVCFVTALNHIFCNATVPEKVVTETRFAVPVASPAQLNAVMVPATVIPADTVWEVDFYGTSSTSIARAGFSRVGYFPQRVPAVVEYVWPKPLDVGYSVSGSAVTVSVNASGRPPRPLIGSGVAVGSFRVAVDNWVVKNVTLGLNGNATLTIKVGHKVGAAYRVETYALVAGDSVPNPYLSYVNWVEVSVDGVVLKSWGSRYSRTYVSGYLHYLLKTYVLGQNRYGVGGYYRIGGVYRAYYAYAGSRFGSLVSVDGDAYLELSPTYWEVELVAQGKWVELTGWDTHWGTAALTPAGAAWADLGLPVTNCTVSGGVPDYGLRANVTVIDAGSNIVARYTGLTMTYVGSRYGLPVFAAPVLDVPLSPDSGRYVLVSVYNATSGRVLWNATRFLAPASITVTGVSFTASSVEYYLAGTDFSNYTLVGWGSLTPNGPTAAVRDTGTSFNYVGHTYKVLNTQDFASAPSLRIKTNFVQLPAPTPTTTATTTTTPTPPWTPPPPTTTPVTFSLITPLLPADGKAHTINAYVIGSPIPSNYANYFVATITEYTPYVSGKSYVWAPYTNSVVTLTQTTVLGDYVLAAAFNKLGLVGSSTVPMMFEGQVVDLRSSTVTGVIAPFFNFKGTVTYTTTIGGTPTSIPVTPRPTSITPIGVVGVVGLVFLPSLVMVLALLRGRLRLGELLGRLLREYRVESLAYVSCLVGLILLFTLT